MHPWRRWTLVLAADVFLLGAGCSEGTFFVEGDDPGLPEVQELPPDAVDAAPDADAQDVPGDGDPDNTEAPDADLPADPTPDPDVVPDPDLDSPADPDVTEELPPPGINVMNIIAGGYSRTYLLYVPSGIVANAPLLVALHGNGDTADNFLAYSRLQSVADAHGVLLAVPQALTGSGPSGVDWDSYTVPASSNKDHQLVLEIINRTRATGAVDSRRIFILGYSQGGFMCFYSGMVLADIVGAIHVQSAGNPMPGGTLVSDAPRTIPVDLLIGEDDSLLDVARDTRDELQTMGHVVRYEEVPGHGHCCFLYDRVEGLWTWLASNPLP
jgi:predicted esterase